MSVNGPEQLKLAECAPGQHLMDWTTFVQKALVTHQTAGRKYIYLNTNDNLFELSEAPKEGYTRLNVFSIQEIFKRHIEAEVNCTQVDEIKQINDTLSLLKGRVRNKYYGCLKGFIRRLLAIFLKRFQFENTVVGQRFMDIEKRLPLIPSDNEGSQEDQALSWYVSSRNISKQVEVKEACLAHWKQLSFIQLAKESQYVPKSVSQAYYEFLKDASKTYFEKLTASKSKNKSKKTKEKTDAQPVFEPYFKGVFAYALSPEALKIITNDYKTVVKKYLETDSKMFSLCLGNLARKMQKNIEKIKQALDQTSNLLDNSKNGGDLLVIDRIEKVEVESQINPYFFELLKDHIRSLAHDNFSLVLAAGLDDDVLVILLDVLEYVYYLDLSDNAITSKGMQMLSEKMIALHVAGKNYPDVLRLKNNKIDATGLQSLREMMEKSSNHRLEVYLEGNPISESCREEVKNWKLDRKKQFILFDEKDEERMKEVDSAQDSERDHSSGLSQNKSGLEQKRLHGLGVLNIKKPYSAVGSTGQDSVDRIELKKRLDAIQNELKFDNKIIDQYLKELEKYLAFLQPEKTDLIPTGLSKFQRFAMVYELIHSCYDAAHLENLKKAVVPGYLKFKHPEWLSQISER